MLHHLKPLTLLFSLHFLIFSSSSAVSMKREIFDRLDPAKKISFSSYEDISKSEFEDYALSVTQKGKLLVPDLSEALTSWFKNHETIDGWHDFYISESGKKIRPVKKLRDYGVKVMGAFSGPKRLDYSVWQFEVVDSHGAVPQVEKIVVKMLPEPAVGCARWSNQNYSQMNTMNNLYALQERMIQTPLVYGEKLITTPKLAIKYAIIMENTYESFDGRRMRLDLTNPDELKFFTTQILQVIQSMHDLGLYTENLSPQNFSYRMVNGKPQIVGLDLELGVYYENFLHRHCQEIKFKHGDYLPIDVNFSSSSISDASVILNSWNSSHDSVSSGLARSREPRLTLSFILGMLFTEKLCHASHVKFMKRNQKHWKLWDKDMPRMDLLMKKESQVIEGYKRQLDKIAAKVSNPRLSEQIKIIKQMIHVCGNQRIELFEALEMLNDT